MDQGTALIRLAIFGQPVTTSLSPRIHRMFATQFGLDIDYQRIETGPADFPERLLKFGLEGGHGCNITVPLKRVAWQLTTDHGTAVSLAEAANTLVRLESGWASHNTDGAGLMTDLYDNHGINIEGQRVLVVGAGGAVAGILGSLLAANPKQVVLVNRNLARAQSLAMRFNACGEIEAVGWPDLDAQGSFGLIINATSLGHQQQAPPLQARQFADNAVCYDLNYATASHPLRQLCEHLGKNYIDGLGMLVGQAAESFYLWTRKRPATAAVIEACRSTPDSARDPK